MKKIIVLFLSVTLFTVNMKAAEPKNPFVKWITVPQSPEKTKLIAWLHQAMQGETIAGAKVYANSNSYISVWGNDLYQQILNGDTRLFSLTYSKGGETNYGVDQNKKSVATGTLPAGITTISFANTQIAKYGSNGCLNAISETEATAYDNDEIPFDNNQKRKPSSWATNGSGGSNSNYTGPTSITVNVTPAPEQQRYSGNNSIGYSNSNPQVMYQQPPVQSYGYQQASFQQQAPIVEQKIPFGMTFGGQVLSNTLGAVAGYGIGQLLWPQRCVSGNFNQPLSSVPINNGGPWTILN